ncbi:MAG: fimbrillin family protein [Alistipes sp.]|nr:fimbrillin family protein [Alistipes sp.]
MKKLFFSLLAVAAMASCSKSELANRPNIDRDNVEIMASSVAKSITRTPYEGNIATDNELTARVLVSETAGDYSTLLNTDYKMVFSDVASNANSQVGFATTPCFFPADGGKVYLSGFHPYDGWTEIVTNGPNYFFAIDGKSDLMAAAEQATDKAEALAGTYPTLTFKHLLTKLVIKVQAEDDNAITSWGKITDMYLTKAASSAIRAWAQVKKSEDTATFRADNDGNNLDKLACYSYDENNKPTDTEFSAIALTVPDTEAGEVAPAVAYSMIHPVTATEKHYTLVVKTEKHTEEYPIDLTLYKKGSTDVFTDPTTGYAFEISLTFKAKAIQAKATVTPWAEGGNTNVDIE